MPESIPQQMKATVIDRYGGPEELHVATLPVHHRDPFDRLLIAQAQLEHLPILTSDPVFAAYDVRTIAAS